MSEAGSTRAGKEVQQHRDDVPTIVYPCQVDISSDRTMMATSDPIHHKIFITDLSKTRSKSATKLLTGNHCGFADGIAYHAVGKMQE